jgi:hypothetical protein
VCASPCGDALTDPTFAVLIADDRSRWVVESMVPDSRQYREVVDAVVLAVPVNVVNLEPVRHRQSGVVQRDAVFHDVAVAACERVAWYPEVHVPVVADSPSEAVVRSRCASSGVHVDHAPIP